MDKSSGRTYWHQQEMHQTNKPTMKFPVNNQTSNQFVDSHCYPTNNMNNHNSLKRTHVASNQQMSPLKKRHLIQQITPPPTSSADHTDDDEDDDEEDGESSHQNASRSKTEKQTNTKRDDNERRAAHTAAEQKRRNAIRRGYDTLQSLVPNSHLLDPISSQKVSKAAILKRSTDYLLQLNKEREELREQLVSHQKETYCLRAVQKSYEDILEMNTISRRNASATIDEEHKIQVFQNIADAIFHSFDQAMQSANTSDFSQFTSAILRWVEDSCRPSDINEIIRRITDNLKS